MMEEDNFKDDTFLARWLNGELSEEERRQFEAQEDYAIYQKIARTTEELKLPARDKTKQWEALQESMKDGAKEARQSAKIVGLNNWWKYAAAACMVLLVGYWFLLPQDGLRSHRTAAASQERISLPDGSTVVLNAESSIQYDAASFAEERNLNLEGEAFFEVKKGSSFTVITPNGSVLVLGTSFNVYARKDKIDLLCYTGKVGLSFDDFKAMEVLLPGDRVVAAKQKIVQKMQVALTQAKPAWTQGQSKFEQVNFVEVIESLERQFGVSISYPSEVAQLPLYNGGFPHRDLATALEIVCSSVGYQYRINGKQVVLEKARQE